jgi:hypothetical protein
VPVLTSFSAFSKAPGQGEVEDGKEATLKSLLKPANYNSQNVIHTINIS